MSHELMHRRSRLERALSMVLLSTVCFGVFKLVHLNVHHRHVGTSQDPSSATRGQNVYTFLVQAVAATFRNGLRLSAAQPQRRPNDKLRMELAFGYVLSAVWLTSVVTVYGWFAGGFFLAQSVVAMLKLEWMNYLQHYGLTRETAPDGTVERVQIHHAWCQERVVTNLAMLNLLRHGQHHVSPHQPYYALSPEPSAPTYPLDFSLMFLVSLYPKLFRTIVHPILDGLPQGANAMRETAS